MKWKALDWLLLCICLAITLFSFWWVQSRQEGTRTLYIKTQEGEWYYSLDDDKDLHFHGPLGDTTIEIHQGNVKVLDSPCRNKICINASPLNEIGDWNACLPNQIFLSIQGQAKTGGLDDQTY